MVPILIPHINEINSPILRLFFKRLIMVSLLLLYTTFILITNFCQFTTLKLELLLVTYKKWVFNIRGESTFKYMLHYPYQEKWKVPKNSMLTY